MGGQRTPVVVFLHGFMSPPRSYGALLAPLRAAGLEVVAPSLDPLGPAALLGGHPVEDESAAAAGLVRDLAERRRRPVALAGHSRGGQAAYRATGLLAGSGLVDSLVLVDPVDGGGRPPQVRTSTSAPAAFDTPALVVGAGLGGRCAPEPVNHEAFADACPRARHVVVPDLGHADVLDGRSRTLGRRLCAGGSDPDAGRAAVSRLLVSFVRAQEVADDPLVTILS